MSTTLRNALSAALFVVALFGAYLDYKQARLGIGPIGQHRIVIAAYLLIAVYAAASVLIRWRATRNR